jgi:hypothetical protein
MAIKTPSELDAEIRIRQKKSAVNLFNGKPFHPISGRHYSFDQIEATDRAAGVYSFERTSEMMRLQ